MDHIIYLPPQPEEEDTKAHLFYNKKRRFRNPSRHVVADFKPGSDHIKPSALDGQTSTRFSPSQYTESNDHKPHHHHHKDHPDEAKFNANKPKFLLPAQLYKSLFATAVLQKNASSSPSPLDDSLVSSPTPPQNPRDNSNNSAKMNSLSDTFHGQPFPRNLLFSCSDHQATTSPRPPPIKQKLFPDRTTTPDMKLSEDVDDEVICIRWGIDFKCSIGFEFN